MVQPPRLSGPDSTRYDLRLTRGILDCCSTVPLRQCDLLCNRKPPGRRFYQWLKLIYRILRVRPAFCKDDPGCKKCPFLRIESHCCFSSRIILVLKTSL